MLKRILCALLAGMMLIPLTACSDNNSDDTEPSNENNPVSESTGGEEETSPYLDDLPEDLHFDDLDIRFVVEEGSNGNLSEKSIWVEEDTADVVDSAIYERNIIVSERLGVNIVLQDVLGMNTLLEPLRTAVSSNVPDYDVVGFYQYYGIGAAAEGLLYNLNNLEYNNFDAEYWATQYMEDMSYKDATYWATGDLSLRYTGGLYVTYVNDRIVNENYPGFDVYGMVDEGAWTLDKMYELSSGVYFDENANDTVDADDTCGLSLICIDLIDGLAAGSLIEFGDLDEEGMPQITLNNEKTYAFYDKMYRMLYNNQGYYESIDDDSATLMTKFNEGRYMLTVNKLYQSEIYLREMEDDFKIIPLPKFDEAQAHYNTRVHDSVTIFGTPITAYDKFDAISATLEAMASESHKNVSPAYYEVALKTRYVRDSDSGRMIDLIAQNVSCDFVTLYSNRISNINWFFRTQLLNQTQSIASQLKVNTKVWGKSAETLVEDFEEVAYNQSK